MHLHVPGLRRGEGVGHLEHLVSAWAGAKDMPIAIRVRADTDPSSPARNGRDVLERGFMGFPLVAERPTSMVVRGQAS